MNALLSYGSDDDDSSDDKQLDYQTSWPKANQNRRLGPFATKQADVNYEEVQMDLSEESDDSRNGTDKPQQNPRDRLTAGSKETEYKTDRVRDSRDDYRSSGGRREERPKEDRGRQEERSRGDDRSSSSRMDDRSSKEDRVRSDRYRDDDKYSSRSDRDDDKDNRRDRDRDRYRDDRDRYRDRRDRSRDRRSRRSSSRDRKRGSRSPKYDRRRSRSRSRERFPRGGYRGRYERPGARGAPFEKQAGDSQRPEEDKVVDDANKDRFFMPGITGRFRDQIEKRKLLWQKKEPPKSEPGTTAPVAVTTTTSRTTKVWEATTFAQDNDGKVASKFKRLMGIRTDEAHPNKPATDVLKRQEEMFSSMEQQYEVARTATHTMRGVGLGFGSFQR